MRCLVKPNYYNFSLFKKEGHHQWHSQRGQGTCPHIPNNLLPSRVLFFQAENVPKPFSARALPQTPLGELTEYDGPQTS